MPNLNDLTLLKPDGTPWPNGVCIVPATAQTGDVIAKVGGLSPTLPAITLGAVTQAEGNSGTTAFNHAGTLTRNDATGALTVSIVVTPNGASANPATAQDFVGGAFPTFNVAVPVNSASFTVSIPVAGDVLFEDNHSYVVTATIVEYPSVSTTAIGTITNDDAPNPVLGPTAASFNVGAASGTTVATITNLIAGETVTGLTPNDGRMAIAGGGTKIVIGLSASSAGTTSYTLTTSMGRQLVIAVTAAPAAALPLPAALVMQFMPEDITGLADGADIPTWTDRKNGAVATGAAGERFVYKVNRQGGKPAVVGTKDVGYQGMSITNAAALQAAYASGNHTTIVVMKSISANNNDYSGIRRPVFGAYDANTNPGGFRLRADAVSFGMDANRLAAGVVPFAAYLDTFSTIGFTSTTFHITNSDFPSNPEQQLGTGYTRLFVNGGAVGSTLNSPTVETAPNLGIGIRLSADAQNIPFKGDILGIFSWNAELSLGEMIQFERYIRDYLAAPYPWSAAYSAANTSPDALLAFDGDSIVAGYGVVLTSSYPYLIAQALGLPYGAWTNGGWSGIHNNAMLANAPTRIDPILPAVGANVKVVLHAGEYVNSGQDANNVANLDNYYSGRVAAGLPVARIVGFNTTSWNGEGSSGKTQLVAHFADPANRAGKIGQLVDVANDNNIGVNGAFNNAAMFSDGLHLTAAGHVVHKDRSLPKIQLALAA